MIPSASPKKPSSSRDFGRYAGLGLQFAVTLALFGALGYWLDSRFGSTPWLLVTGILFGSVFAFIAIVKAVPAARPPRSQKPPR